MTYYRRKIAGFLIICMMFSVICNGSMVRAEETTDTEETTVPMSILAMNETPEVTVTATPATNDTGDVEVTPTPTSTPTVTPDPNMVQGTSEEWEYSLDENNKATITGYKGEETEIRIPDMVDGYTVVAIGEYAFYAKSELKSVKFPSSLEEIGASAFSECEALTGSLVIPEGVTKIGNYAFNGCGFTGTLSLPESLEIIEDHAFCNVEFSGELKIPSKVSVISEGAFENCDFFTGDLVIPEGVTEIERYAFSNCTRIGDDVIIAEGVTTIGECAFMGCMAVEKIYVPASVTRIDEGGLTTNGECAICSYPGTAAEEYATQDWGPSFIDLSVTPTASPAPDISVTPTASPTPTPVFSPSPDDVKGSSAEWKYKITNGEVTLKKYLGTSTEVRIPDIMSGYPVTEIGEECFYFNEEITSVIFSKYLKKIGQAAFSNCVNLKGELVLPSGLVEIGMDAFFCCGFEGEFVMPDTIQVIGDCAFYFCDGLRKVYMPNTDMEIGGRAFELSAMTMYGKTGSAAYEYAKGWGIPFVDESLPAPTPAFTPDEDAVEGAWEDWYYRITETGEVVLKKYLGSSKEVRIPDVLEGYPVTSIDDYFMYSHVAITQITLPKYLKKIGTRAFGNCFSVETMYIGATDIEISDTAFDGCTITIYGTPGSTVETYANENGFTFVDIATVSPVPTGTPTSKPTYPDWDYEIADGKVTLKSYTGTDSEVYVPESIDGYPVTSIKEGAFAGNVNITIVHIPVTVVHIEEGAFVNSNVTIYSVPGSAAETYAKQCGLSFVQEASVTPAPVMTSTPAPIVDLSIKIQKKKSDYPKLSWKKNVNVTSYEVYRSTKRNKGYRCVKVLSANKTSYTDKKSKRGKTYYYKVRAICVNNGKRQEGNFSNVVKAKRQYLITPVIKVKKSGGKNPELAIKLKKKQGKFVEIYYQKGNGKKIKIKLRSAKIKKVYRLKYKTTAKKMTFWIRTYTQKGKKKYYSQYTKCKI